MMFVNPFLISGSSTVGREENTKVRENENHCSEEKGNSQQQVQEETEKLKEYVKPSSKIALLEVSAVAAVNAAVEVVSGKSVLFTVQYLQF